MKNMKKLSIQALGVLCAIAAVGCTDLSKTVP